jgi:hypothetical protein
MEMCYKSLHCDNMKKSLVMIQTMMGSLLVPEEKFQSFFLPPIGN